MKNYKNEIYNKKGGTLEGNGTYGVVYSSPRLPYIINEKYNFNNNKITENNITNNSIQKNEVSKVFYEKKDYIEEKDKYILLNKYNLPDNYFNIPLAYGSIDIDFIKKNLAKNNRNSTKIYTNNWSEKNNTFKTKAYQITSKKGFDIVKNNNIKSFYIKFKNILDYIKFMDNNNLLFDDFKIGNTLDVDNKFKISDFSSLIHLSEISTKYNDLFLKHMFYFINSPVINTLIYYYMGNRNIIKYINEDKKEMKDSIVYRNKMLNKIKNIMPPFDITINVNYFSKSDKIFKKVKICKKSIDYINILIDELNIINYLDNYIKFLNLKYNNNSNNILNELLKKINLYSVGIYIFSFLYEKIGYENLSNNDNIILKNLISIGINLCITLFKDDTNTYINLSDIDSIIKIYNKNSNINVNNSSNTTELLSSDFSNISSELSFKPPPLSKRKHANNFSEIKFFQPSKRLGNTMNNIKIKPQFNNKSVYDKNKNSNKLKSIAETAMAKLKKTNNANNANSVNNFNISNNNFNNRIIPRAI